MPPCCPPLSVSGFKMAKDFTGARQGKLSILCLSHVGIYGGKSVNFWCCLCDCGREEIIPQTKLSKQTECSVCRRGPCCICGASIPDHRPRSNTCCEACEGLKLKSASLRHYAKIASPAFNKARYQRSKIREQESPELKERRKERERIYKSRYRQNPEIIAKNREYQKSRWQEMKDLIKAQRAAFADSLSPDEREQRRKNLRKYSREYRRRFREWLFAHPDEHEKYKLKQREWAIERKRRNALAQLLADSQKLLNRNNDNE